MALPLILAGPVVRRVEPRLVSIWIALSEAADVEVSVWLQHQFATTTPGKVKSGDAPWAKNSGPTVRVGEHLHVALVTVAAEQPLPALPPGTICAYDVAVKAGNEIVDLKKAGLLRDEPGDSDVDARPPQPALGYTPDRLPSFVTCPASLDDLVLAHASCRKTTGPGHDAMAYMDQAIETNLAFPDTRPHQLFLTGDQIYADTVSMVLLPMLNEVGEELFGRFETLPLAKTGETTISEIPGTIASFPAERRRKLVQDVAEFTTSSGSNHLLTLAEYCAMYLAAWSPSVWRELAAAEDIFKTTNSVVAGSLTDQERCQKPQLKADEELTEADRKARLERWKTSATRKPGSSFNRHDALTKLYRRGVPFVRRALANVATYMVFDDHEITDDWNLTQQWRNRVNTSPLGRTILRNGLVAFTIFQGWGNDPKQFEQGKARDLLEAIGSLIPSTGQAPATTPGNTIDELLGLAGADPAIRWHFTIDGPVHRVAALDTRTRRTFPGRVSPPSLLGDTLAAQMPKAPLDAGLELLVVISAAPVLGPVLIDQIGQPLRIIIEDHSVYIKRADYARTRGACEPEDLMKGFEEFDAEGWARNEVAFEDFVKRAAGHPNVVVLSGDVHYGMSLTLDYWKKGQTNAAGSRIVQLTSSGTRNNFKPIVEYLMRAAAVGQRIQTIGMPAVRFGWDESGDTLDFPDGSSIRPGIRARLNRDPVLVPGNGWPPGTTIAREPDYRWQLDMVRDARTDAERPAALAPPATLAADFDETDPIDSFFDLAARHAQAAAHHYNHVRQIVFPNNVGIVRFPTNGTGRMVRHELHSADPDDPRRASRDFPNTVHEVSLEPLQAAPPPLVTAETGDG